MDLLILGLAVLAGYLIGAVSFSRIAARVLSPEKNLEDIQVPVEGTDKTHTIHGISATTIGMVSGEKAGCLVGILDMAKVTIPTLIARLLYPDQPYFLFLAVAAMVGHNWPVYYKFKGGHGISSIFGSLLAIDWLGALLVPNIGLLVGLFVFKNFMIAYLAGVWLLIPWVWLRTHDLYHLGYAVAVNLLFMLSMLPDIKQVKEQKQYQTEPEDLRQTMMKFPMGKGILKIMDRFNIPIG